MLTKEDGKEQTLGFIQKSVLEFRQSALTIVQDRQKDVNDRINDLLHLCKADVNEKDFGKILKAFRSLEKLDKSWAKRLKSLKGKPFTQKTEESLSIYCEQFLANGLYEVIHLFNNTDAEKGFDLKKTIVAVGGHGCVQEGKATVPAGSMAYFVVEKDA